LLDPPHHEVSCDFTATACGTINQVHSRELSIEAIGKLQMPMANEPSSHGVHLLPAVQYQERRGEAIKSLAKIRQKEINSRETPRPEPIFRKGDLRRIIRGKISNVLPIGTGMFNFQRASQQASVIFDDFR
jgi:hypothetical protein